MSYKKTGVTLIIGDSLRYDYVSFYGVKDNITPYIDNMARYSYSFTQCYSLAPGTTGSTAHLLTGDIDCKHTGIWEKTPYSQYLPLIKTKALISAVDTVDKWAVDFDYFHAIRGHWMYKGYINSYKRMLSHDVDFIYIHCFYPHHPYQQIGQSVIVKLIESGGGKAHGPVENQSVFDEHKQELIELYTKGVKSFDKIVNLVHKADPTRALIITSDHGECLGEGNWFGHNKSHEATLHIPLIIWLPDNLMGYSVAANVNNTQTIKTIIELLYGDKIDNSLLEYCHPQPSDPQTIQKLRELGYIQ